MVINTQRWRLIARLTFLALGGAGLWASGAIAVASEQPQPEFLEKNCPSYTSIYLNVDIQAVNHAVYKDQNLLDFVTKCGEVAVPQLVEAIGSKCRCERGNSLREIIPPRTDNSLEQNSEQSQYLGIYALGQIRAAPDCSVPALREALKSNSLLLRITAIDALAKFGDSAREAVPILIDLLSNAKDNEVEVRISAVKALEQIGVQNQQVEDALIMAIGDSSETVRANAIHALGQVDSLPQSAILLMINALQHDTPFVRANAAYSLGKVNLYGNNVDANSVVPELLHALQDNQAEVSEAAIYALRNVGGNDPIVIRGLISAVEHGNEKVRIRATQLLGRIGAGHVDVIPALIRASENHKSLNLRYVALNALAEVGASNPATVQVLLGALTDPNDFIKIIAADILSKFSPLDARAVQPLINLFRSDDNPDVQVMAAYALGKVTTEADILEAIDLLLNALQTSDNADIRAVAANALGRLANARVHLGGGDRRIVDALVNVLKDEMEDPLVRHSSSEALEFLKDKGSADAATALNELREVVSQLDSEIAVTQLLEIDRVGVEALIDAIRKRIKGLLSGG
jgi:HEAT repeat protein